MNTVQSWMLSVSMACIIAALLQQLISDKAKYSVIKMVATLYILVVSLSPLRSLQSVPQYYIPSASLQSVAVDTQALMMQQAKATLENEARNLCAQKGYPVQMLAISLSQANDEIQLDSIEVVTANQYTQPIYEVLQSWAGTQTAIVVKEGM